MFMWFKRTGLPTIAVFLLGCAIGLGLVSPVRTAISQAQADSETQLLRDVYARVNPSVVSITVRIPRGANIPDSAVPDQQGSQPYAYAAGSGFIVDNQGHIVTNAHVVAGTDKVEITFSDDTMMRATIVGIDLDSDLAVIKADSDTSKYKPLTLADSDALTVGDRAIAIGNPFGRAGTMTQGVVSGLHRTVSGIAQANNGGQYQIPDAIQTDAALNPGNSGGPLLDWQGNVIGVNEQIASEVRQSSGVSFAIPSNLVKLITEQLISNGKVEHSWLGIAGGDLSLDINEALKLPANQRGAYVSNVQAGPCR